MADLSAGRLFSTESILPQTPHADKSNFRLYSCERMIRIVGVQLAQAARTTTITLATITHQPTPAMDTHSELPRTTANGGPAATALFDRFARFYDDDYRAYDDDLGLILEMAEEADGPVVELGCGTGRVLLPLADAGITATGVDISPALLDVARVKLAAAGLAARVELVEADLRRPGLPESSFALAVCTSNTLMHLTEAADQEDALRAARRLLRPGGRLMLDLFNPDLPRLLEVNGLMELADSWRDEVAGVDVTKWSVRSVDIAEQIQETLFIYEETLPSGETRRTHCPFTLRFLWRNEGELMLRAAGFVVEEVWGEFDSTPYDAMSDHLIFIARRP